MFAMSKSNEYLIRCWSGKFFSISLISLLEFGLHLFWPEFRKICIWYVFTEVQWVWIWRVEKFLILLEKRYFLFFYLWLIHIADTNNQKSMRKRNLIAMMICYGIKYFRNLIFILVLHFWQWQHFQIEIVRTERKSNNLFKFNRRKKLL